jgi:hypothetical protein
MTYIPEVKPMTKGEKYYIVFIITVIIILIILMITTGRISY